MKIVLNLSFLCEMLGVTVVMAIVLFAGIREVPTAGARERQ